MRADRLISLLMLLQVRGRMTCPQLAQELEVSERTIYRDVEALSAAGFPIYTERGPGGGILLLEEYRTTLTGFSPEQVRALFMLSVPAPLDELGLGNELKTALLKLAAALPASQWEDEQKTQNRIYVDPQSWFHTSESLPALNVLYQAVWQEKWVRARLLLAFEAEIEMTLAPYGLVAKANTWYLVSRASDFTRVDRVSSIHQAEILPQGFRRDPQFQLVDYWEAWCRRQEEQRPHFPVTVRVSGELIAHPWSGFKQVIERRARTHQIEEDGWHRISLDFENHVSARRELMVYGGAVEVLEPLQLRRSILDFAQQITSIYTHKDNAT